MCTCILYECYVNIVLLLYQYYHDIIAITRICNFGGKMSGWKKSGGKMSAFARTFSPQNFFLRIFQIFYFSLIIHVYAIISHYTLSALIPPDLIPPHFANVTVIRARPAEERAGGRKGRWKKRPAEKAVRVQCHSKSIPSQY